MKLVAAVIAIACAGCQHGEDSGAAPAASAARDASVAKPPPPTPAVAPAPQFEVLDAGREPRSVLRYHVPPHTSSALAVTVATELLGQRGPAVTLATELAVGDGANGAAGEMPLTMTVRDVSVTGSGAAGAMYGAQLAALHKLTLTETLLPSGAVRDVHVAAPAPDAPLASDLAAFSRSAEQLTLTLPDVAVGVGARWRTVRTTKLGALTTTITTTIEVTAITGDRVAYTLQTALAGPPQTIEQAGVTLAVDQIAGHGTGDGTLDLGTLATTQKLTEALTAHAAIGGVSSPMDASTTITIAPR